MNTLEKDIESKLRDKVKSYGGECQKWLSPSSSRVPDRIVLMPGGRIIFVETKRPKGGRTSGLQRWWAQRLSTLGFSHWFIHDEVDLARFTMMELAPYDLSDE